jgi:hypothetical protein
MAPRPYRPAAELEAALERGELSLARVLAKDVSEERGRPIDLDVALRFLPLVAIQNAEAYDDWAMRWLGRWIRETPGATIEQAAELAGTLADLPTEPTALAALRDLAGPWCRRR